MKPFKFFQKEIRKFNVYEEMVLGMLEYCRNNTISPIGMSHPFHIMTLEGIKLKSIVIRNVLKSSPSPLRSNMVIEYYVFTINDNEEDTSIGNVLTIDEEEYHRLTEY